MFMWFGNRDNKQRTKTKGRETSEHAMSLNIVKGTIEQLI